MSSTLLYSISTLSVNMVVKFIRTSFAYIILMLFLSTANAAILLDAGWEYGTFNDYYFNISTNDYGMRIVDGPVDGAPTCSGTKSIKNELIYGQGSAWSQLTLNMKPFNDIQIGRRHWYAFAIYLPTDYVPDTFGELIWEIHSRPDYDGGEVSRNAPIALRIDGDEWHASYIKDSRYITYTGDGNKVYEESGSIPIGKTETGKWTVFVIDTLFDYRSSGYVKIWKDGSLVVNKTNGIGFNDDRGGFMKIGLYKAIWNLSKSWTSATAVSSRTLYIDDFRVGDANTTYAEIAPVCNNNSPAILTSPSGLSLEIR